MMLAIAIIVTVLFLEAIIFLPGILMGIEWSEIFKVVGYIHIALVVMALAIFGLGLLWMAAV